MAKQVIRWALALFLYAGLRGESVERHIRAATETVVNEHDDPGWENRTDDSAKLPGS
ncbi:MAG: hypothetical protein O2992_05500 [Gemmatimonadetes bacterium]|jgi:hypothetical protein|nr:hypothetical protein [Gemmatimonadota bacterium]